MAKAMSQEKALEKLMEIVGRFGIEPVRENRTLIFKLEDNKTAWMNISEDLWKLSFDTHFQKYFERDIQDDSIKYPIALSENYEWIDVPYPEKLYAGERIKIVVENDEIAITKEMFPIKLKKAEYDNLQYQLIHKGDNLFFIIRKAFNLSDNWYFNIYRPFVVI